MYLYKDYICQFVTSFVAFYLIEYLKMTSYGRGEFDGFSSYQAGGGRSKYLNLKKKTFIILLKNGRD